MDEPIKKIFIRLKKESKIFEIVAISKDEKNWFLFPEKFNKLSLHVDIMITPKVIYACESMKKSTKIKYGNIILYNLTLTADTILGIVLLTIEAIFYFASSPITNY